MNGEKHGFMGMFNRVEPHKELPPKPSEDEGGISRRKFLGLAAGAGALAVAGVCGVGCEREDGEMSKELNQYLSNPDFSRPFPNGEFTDEERAERTKVLSPDVEILEDVGLVFYRVRGEKNRTEIAKKLAEADPDRFGYLLNKAEKIESFNIPRKSLQANMWIPIPVPKEHRKIDDNHFKEFAEDAISDMQADPVYKEYVEELLEQVPKDKLVAVMAAVAKQESGGSQGTGTYELHRYEHSHQCFSFSHFHVLMEGPGLKARRKLNMTEGQIYHPRNSCRLFLAFLIEKTKEMTGSGPKATTAVAKSLGRRLPFDDREKTERFASFYNGSSWRRTNPQYMNVIKYYESILNK